METLLSILFYTNRIVPIIQIILGTFGNVMNILIFTRQTLRTNPCSHYFLASSINNLFVLYEALLTRLLTSAWHIDPTLSNSILCKLRLYFAFTSLCLIQWLVVLASIDRYLSSCRSQTYRRLSSIATARKAIVSAVLFILLIYFHIPIWWTTGYVESVPVCNIFIDVYNVFFTIFNIVVSSLIPPILMLFFGLKTILNVHKSRTQVMPQSSNGQNERLRSKDRQMITMLLFQVTLTVICTVPFGAVNVYSTINDNIETSPLSPSALVVYNFCVNIFRLLNYCNAIIGFYIYTLTSRTFRKEIRKIWKNGFNIIISFFHRNQ